MKKNEYIEKLNGAIATLLAVNPDEEMDDQILKTARDLNEIIYYFKNSM